MERDPDLPPPCPYGDLRMTRLFVLMSFQTRARAIIRSPLTNAYSSGLGLRVDLLISTKAADANIYKKPDGTTTKDSYNRTAGEAGSKSYSPDVQGWPVIGHCRVDFRLRRCFPDLLALLPPVLRQDSAERRQKSRCVLCLTW